MTHTSRHRLGGLAGVGVASLAAWAAFSGPTAVAGAAGAQRSPRATAAASGAKIGLGATSLGKILVNSRGHTLYAFTRDRRNRDRCVSITGCTGAWPVVSTGAAPTAGGGVSSSKLSSIKLAGGKRQVTYDGHPLYTYVADSSAGETGYVGVSQFGGKWLALKASGSLTG